jgi:hypothetical protein
MTLPSSASQAPAPRCKHCAYDLSGIETVNFMALCPECGQRSDILKIPEPTFPWWHTPAALLAGFGTYALIFAAYVFSHQFSNTMPEAIKFASGVGAPAIGAAVSILTLRRNYAALWRHRYGRTRWPLRGLISLIIDWILWTFVLSFFPYVFFALVMWLWP